MKPSCKTLPLAIALAVLSLGAAKSALANGVEIQGTTPSYSASQDDVFAWCANYISDLQNVRWTARMDASMGALDMAAQKLLAELHAKAAQIGTGYVDPAPHTVIAIRTGLSIAESLVTALRAEALPRTLVQQIAYFSIDQIYQLIENAYFNLDQKYYMDVISTCQDNRFGGCGKHHHGPSEISDGLIGMLPAAYFDGVRQLGLSFLNFQILNGQLFASDVVELKVSQAVVHSAREILNASVFRRGMACALVNLENIEKQIGQFLCGSPLPRPSQVQLTRDLVAQARDLVSSSCPTYNSGCGCGRR